MTLDEYCLLLGVLDEAGLLKDNCPDFDKISEITGLSRDTVKVRLAPSAEMPRWVKLTNYIGEQMLMKRKHDFYKTGDLHAPEAIKDRNGEVVLLLCKKCGRAEADLKNKCND